MERYNIEAHLHRLVGKSSKKRERIWVRYYQRIETATQRCIRLLMEEGQVGDVIEFVLKINGDQRGTIQYHADGKISVIWNDTEAKRFRNKLRLAQD